jgi:hypothetical protein
MRGTGRFRGFNAGSRRPTLQRAGANFLDDGAMLIVEAQLEGAQPVFVERQEIAIAGGAVMHYAAATVDGGIENGVGFAAVLGLHVIGHAIEREISIVSEEHFAAFVPLGAMR